MVNKQRCDKCGNKYTSEEGLFKYVGIPKSKWRKLKPEKQRITKWGEKCICKYCQNKSRGSDNQDIPQGS